MASDRFPLPNMPWLEAGFIRADLDDVLSRFRGEMASVADGYEATGTAAQIHLPLGMETYPGMHPPLRDKSDQGFSVHGFARVAVVRCNPDLIFVEAPFAGSSQGFLLHDWCRNAPMLHVWSGYFTYARDPADDEDPSELHGFCYEADGRQRRWMEWKRDQEGTRLINRGKPLACETPSHYMANRTRDRMTRGVLFEILDALHLDPVSIFERRGLDTPYLFNSLGIGTHCGRYTDDRDAYLRFIDSPYPAG